MMLNSENSPEKTGQTAAMQPEIIEDKKTGLRNRLMRGNSEHQTYDNDQIRADFHLLYQQMNGMPLKEMDKVIYPVCGLCRDHERSGFIAGIKIGIRLAEEIG